MAIIRIQPHSDVPAEALAEGLQQYIADLDPTADVGVAFDGSLFVVTGDLELLPRLHAVIGAYPGVAITGVEQ